MTGDEETNRLAQAWSAVAGAEGTALADRAVRIVGTAGDLPSRFPAEAAAVACVGAAWRAASALKPHRSGGAGGGGVTIDRAHITAAVRSERYFALEGRPAGAGFASLSRFWPTADGWLRTHGNYPWHRAALVRALGTSEDPDAVGAALAERRAEEVQEQVVAAGGVAAAVLPLAAWRVHPQGQAVAGEPLVGHERVGDGPPRRRPAGDRLASGVRVVDLTRVIAGPVCTRFLAALGADVLRLDPPRHPDMAPGSVADTLLGKRSALVDFAGADGRATLHGLLDEADVVVCGYRPGALDKHGLGVDALAARHPGLVVVHLAAWGHRGPWAGRRGFDSVVQAPTGIAAGESVDGARPGALPCQLLDHGTGYLAAAAVLDGLRRQADQGGTVVRRLSLAATAWWLTAAPAAAPEREVAPEARGEAGPAADPGPSPWLVTLPTGAGAVTAVRPPGRLDGQPLSWPLPVTRYGSDPPAWSSRRIPTAAPPPPPSP